MSTELRFDAFLNLSNGHALIMQFSRLQRDVLAHRSASGVAIFEAEEIVLVAVVLHAAAEARHLLKNFRNVFGDLV